jgi:hypothetical protein
MRKRAKSAALVFCRRRILATCQPALFILNMYLTIISDLSLAETKTSLLSLPLSSLRNMKAIHYLYCSRCGVEWRKKVKENLLWTEHYLFMVHEACEQLGAARKKGYFIRIYISQEPRPALSYISALHSAPVGVISLASSCVCVLGAWVKSA